MLMLSLIDLTDHELIDKIYRDPYVNRVGHDDRPSVRLDHPAVKYLGAYKNGELMGAFMVIESGFVEIDVHALLFKSALPYSRIFGMMFLDRTFKNKDIHRVTAYVIEGLDTARNYCRKLGFKNEGFRRDACRKEGKLIGVHTLGITRKDWEHRQ